MCTLRKNDIGCPLPVLNVHGSEKSTEKLGDGISTSSIIITLPTWARHLLTSMLMIIWAGKEENVRLESAEMLK